MAELKTTDYAKFKDGIKTQYATLLSEKENELQSINTTIHDLYEQICRKWLEYDMSCALYGFDSQKATILSDEIIMLIQKYDALKEQAKTDTLKKEIDWLKNKM